MAPPKFADIGKAADDLFSDDFGGDANKLTLKSKASNGTAIKVEGSRSNATGGVAALLETKFTHKASGLAIKEKWTTKNVVTTEVASNGKFVDGLNLTFCANFQPNGGGVSDLKLKSAYSTDKFTSNVDVTSSKVAASGVFSFKNFLFGASTNYKLSSGSVSNTSVTVGYTEGDLAVTSTITDAGSVSATLFHTPSADLAAGVELGWNKADGSTTFGVAGQYTLDSTAFTKAKLDSNLNLGLSYVQQLRQGVSLRLSADIDGSQLGADAHSLGLHLTLEN